MNILSCCRLLLLETLFKVRGHYHTIVRRDAEQGEKPDPYGNAQVELPDLEKLPQVDAKE